MYPPPNQHTAAWSFEAAGNRQSCFQPLCTWIWFHWLLLWTYKNKAEDTWSVGSRNGDKAKSVMETCCICAEFISVYSKTCYVVLQSQLLTNICLCLVTVGCLQSADPTLFSVDFLLNVYDRSLPISRESVEFLPWVMAPTSTPLSFTMCSS